MVVLGGLGSVAGAYFGGMIVGIVEAFAGYYIDPELKQAIWFLIFLAVLVVRPTGAGARSTGAVQHNDWFGGRERQQVWTLGGRWERLRRPAKRLGLWK